MHWPHGLRGGPFSPQTLRQTLSRGPLPPNTPASHPPSSAHFPQEVQTPLCTGRPPWVPSLPHGPGNRGLEMSDNSLRASSGSGNWPGACWTGQPASSSPAHLHVPVGEQQVHDDVGAQQLHAVQSPLQASQLLPQLLPAEPLPRPPDVLPNGLPEVATNAQGRRERENGRACPSAPGPPCPHQLLLAPSLRGGPITKSPWAWPPAGGPADPPGV